MKKLMFLCVVMGCVGGMMCGSIAMAADATYKGAKTCKMCHTKAEVGAQYTKWSEMGHSKAFKTLQSDAAKALAKEKGIEGLPEAAPECLQCHVTAYDVKTKAVPAKMVMADGVQCETCHGPASNHMKDGMKFKKDPSIDMSKNIKRGDAKTCAQCHNDKSPTWDPKRYTLKDGTTTGFDFEAAAKKIAHPVPEK